MELNVYRNPSHTVYYGWGEVVVGIKGGGRGGRGGEVEYLY